MFFFEIVKKIFSSFWWNQQRWRRERGDGKRSKL